MANTRDAEDVPACYAHVHPGLEPVAAEEIERDLGGSVKKISRGVVVFRVPEITPDLLKLRTTEDVFLLAWGTDELTYRAADLKSIRHWTAKSADWQKLLRYHHAVRPKPRGKTTWWLVTQMSGTHGYRRVDAREAMAKGLEGVFPASWPVSEENASVEVWLSIQGAQAVCGLRLSDRTMRHRPWKLEHLPASLRPTVAAAMVRLAGPGPDNVLIDPMCGAGTVLAEAVELARRRRAGRLHVLGGDLDRSAARAAVTNTRRLGPVFVARWDACRLPVATGSVDRVVSNPPFGVQLSSPEAIGPLYRSALAEYDRVLRPGGRAVLLAADYSALQDAARRVEWQPARQLKVQVLGQPAVLSVWTKPGA